MIKDPRRRRRISWGLLGVGGFLLLLTPENAWIGLVFAGVGLALEALGVILGHSGPG